MPSPYRVTFLNDYVLVRRLPVPTTTTSGLILSDKAMELPQLATIVGVGPKQNHEHLAIEDLVILPKYGGILFPLLMEDYYLFHNKEILALITED